MKQSAWAFLGVGASALAAVAGLVGCNAVFRFDERPPIDGGDEGGAEAAPTSCTSDTVCGGLRCDVPSGECVSCLGDGDCARALPRCEPTTHLCVACQKASDCGMRKDCDVVTHRCLDACFDLDDPCPSAGFVCDRDRTLCIECRTSANCPASRVCDVPIGRCVECTANAQCPTARPSCDRRTGQCVACLSSGACPVGEVCDPTTLACRKAL